MAKQEKGAVLLSEHAKKYDRQMRLWGAHGQQLLEEGKICVLGSNVAASEILKNCVLPAVGIFTIIDDAEVSISDLGNNFFVTQDDVGKKRAEVVSEWLLEMNPDVSGSALVKNCAQLIADDISYFAQFTIVVSTQMYGEANRKLAAFCWQNGIPFLSVKVNGLMALLRVQYPEICIMESHPSNDRTDLFMSPEQLKLFPELQAFVDSFDVETTDVEKHAHLPCLAILGQYTQRYLSEHDQKLPSTYKEQTEFKDAISEMGNGENYMDAIHWASQCYLPPRIDREVQAVLKDAKAVTIDAQSGDFWVLVRALNDFLENEGGGFLPCSTSIPDMTMDSQSYVALKAIYKARADRDVALIAGYVRKRLASVARGADSIAADLVERFARNVRSLKVVRTKSMAQEYAKGDAEQYEELYLDMSAFEEKDDDEAELPFKPLAVNWYWAFRAMEVFYDAEKRLPGDADDHVAGDVEKLAAIQTSLYKSNQVSDQPVVKECLQEMVRYGGAELHNMGAFVGGVAAQTIMKVLLRQFYTYNHTYVFNGIHCDGQVIAL